MISLFLVGLLALVSLSLLLQSSAQQHVKESFEATTLRNTAAPVAGQENRLRSRRPLLSSEDDTGDVTVVKSVKELRTALMSDTAHIEIQQHLDLTELDPSETGLLGSVRNSVKSIRGNCQGDLPTHRSQRLGASSAPLRPFLANQCLIIVDTTLMTSRFGLWLDNLYVRITTRTDVEDEDFKGVLQVHGWRRKSGSTAPQGALWMTRVTLQGNGDGEKSCSNCGLFLKHALFYAEDCTFANFDGGTVASFTSGSSSSLVNCTFADNTLHSSIEGTAVVLAKADDDTAGDTRVRLQGCSFTGNTPETIPTLLADSRVQSADAVFYGDSASTGIPSCISQEDGEDDCDTGNVRGLQYSGDEFLSANNCWLVDVQKELGLNPPAFSSEPEQSSSAPGPTTQAEDTGVDECIPGPLLEDNSSTLTGRTGAVIAGAIACVLLLVGGTLYCTMFGGMAPRGASVPWQFSARSAF